MSDEERKAALAAWIASRPECIQKLVAEFPLGTSFEMPGGRVLHLVGYNEGDTLIVSETDPHADYERATATQEYLCASHVRGGAARE
jgi:hypothetical protein